MLIRGLAIFHQEPLLNTERFETARETFDAQHEFSLRASSPRTELEVKMAKLQLRTSLFGNIIYEATNTPFGNIYL